jgi:hypothetical protein
MHSCKTTEVESISSLNDCDFFDSLCSFVAALTPLEEGTTTC